MSFSTVEHLLLNYQHSVEYNITPLNAVGPTTSMTLRTVTTHSDSNCKYVRKFGLAYSIKSVSDISSPVTLPGSLKFEIFALDGTSLGYKFGSTFTAGTILSTAQACYLKISNSAGSIACGSSFVIKTDADPSGRTFVLTNETIDNSYDPLDIIEFYLSQTGSTYYDEAMIYGGARHTPDGTQELPYFHPIAAGAACNGSHQIVTVLDSETYDGEITMSGNFLTLQAALGQTPTITCGRGARVTREVRHDGNNLDTCYISNSGNDSTGIGRWQNPYATIPAAITNKGSRTYINIQDSGIYYLAAQQTMTVNLEACYGQTPIIRASSAITGAMFYYGSDSYSISGCVIDGQALSQFGIYGRYSCAVNDNEIMNMISVGIKFIPLVSTQTFSASRNICHDFTSNVPETASGIRMNQSNNGIVSSTYNVTNNIVYNSLTYGIYFADPGWASSGGNINITGNLCRNNGRSGFNLSLSSVYTTVFLNNTGVYNYRNGFESSNIYVASFTIDSCIFYYNNTGAGGNLDVSQGTGPMAITNSCYATISVSITDGGGNIILPPLFQDISDFNYSLSVFSPCLKIGTSNSDMGCNFENILIAVNNTAINGFIFDGQNQFFNAIKQIGSYSGTTVEWCNAKNYLGIAIDPYSGLSAMAWTIKNCLVFNNGSGIRLNNGGNTIQETIVYNNLDCGIYGMCASSIFNHIVAWNNKYGFYFNATSGSTTLKNSITSGNSLYGVYALVLISPTTCDFQDATFGINSGSNLIVDPLFISLLNQLDSFGNEIEGTENFNLKSIQGGYVQPSSLLGLADDGYDIGAYKVSRTNIADNWNQYQFTFNPKKNTDTNTPKGVSIFENSLGSKDLWMLNFKRAFLFDWEDNVIDQADREKVDYFHTLQKNRYFSPSSEIVKFRLHFQPSNFIDNGSGAVVNATNLTLADNTKVWTENKFRGYHVGIKYLKLSGVNVTATAKTIQKSGASWTTNQWAGYYVCINSNYFLILSNTADTLTVSDFYSQLTDGTIASLAIEKYFKINSNTMNVLNLIDDNGELINGNYDWYIDFIEVRVVDPTNTVVQDPFVYLREHSKGAFTISFEEL